ncbi:MAG: DUF4349 domain-containing protein [Tissierellia bacterium]|nr:DUF4349 domain-containing protein [Tissierellia bacterium]
MKEQMRKRILILLLALGMLAGCASPSRVVNDEYAEVAPQATYDQRTSGAVDGSWEAASTEAAAGESVEEKGAGSLEPEKVIVNVQLYYETTDFETMIAGVQKSAEAVGGFIQDSNIVFGSGGHYGSYRNAYYTVRVPRGEIEAFKSGIGSEGSALISENTSKSDATKSYRDSQRRIEVLETKEARLMELLSKAETMENIIALENSLSETIAEKEDLKANLLNIDDMVDYSTLDIQIQEVAKSTIVEDVQITYFDRLKNAITGSARGFTSGVGNFIIELIYLLPYLLVLAFLFFILRWIYRWAKKHVRLPASSKPGKTIWRKQDQKASQRPDANQGKEAEKDIDQGN